MEVFEAIKGRRSIRNYLDKEVEEEKLKKILEAARWAPSGSNRQPWHFIVVQKQMHRKQLRKAAHDQAFVEEAPIVIVVCTNEGANMVNIGLAMQNICLEAYALGLGTCIVGWFESDEVDELLEIPKKFTSAYLIPLGYPKEEPTSDRKDLEDIVHYEKW